MQWMLWMVVVSVYTQVAQTEEQEPINRDGRLLFKNREWTDEYRSAVSTIERDAATQPQFLLEDDNLLDVLEPRPFLTGRGGGGRGGGSQGRRSGAGGGTIPTFRFPSDNSEEEGQQDLVERSLSHRQGRVLNSPSLNSSSSDGLASRELQQEKPLSGETSRKASPDVQDIIDGIVKLLGGKVHNGTPGGGQQPGGYGQRPPPLSSPNPVYNLFNPTKPIVFPTSKPTRVNNRGPGGLSSGGGASGGGGHQAGYPATSDPSSNSPQSSFEAIPLEALNSEFNLNKSYFGPPFPLNKVVGGTTGGGGVDAPYKKGVPVPEQLVPTLPSSSGGNYNNRYSNPPPPPYPQYNYNPNFSNSNYGTTLLNPTSGRPTTSGTRKPPSSSTLLNPVNNSPGGISSRPVVTTQGEVVEDDEEDELRFTTHPAGGISSPGEIIPIRQEDFKVTTKSVEIRPTPTLPPPGGDNVYPTLVLETNSENGLVEIVTKYETFSVSPTAAFHTPSVSPQASVGGPFFPPGGDGHKHVSSLSTSTSASLSTTTKGSTTTGLSSSTSNPLVSSSLGPQSIHSFPTPPLRPGIVLNENAVGGSRGGGVGSVEVVTALDGQHGLVVPGGAGGAGEVFDVTVTAKQSYGGQNTGLPFGLGGPGVVGEVVKDEVITVPKGTEQFVSIDGKRTYFNLQPNTALPGGGGVTGIPGKIAASSAVVPTQSVRGTILPVLDGPSVTSGGTTRMSSTSTQKPSRPQSIGVGSVGDPVPLLPQAPGKTLFNSNTPVRPVSTSLNIQPGDKANPQGNKSPPNLVRRPFGRRPTVPPVRIDTCIVGDDSTCNSEQFEVCRTENGVSSCVCRSGYARRKHREPCKAIVSLIMSIKLEKLGDKKLSYNPDYFNPNSEIYQTLEWETIHALDSSMSETTLSGGYVGSKLDSIGFDGKHAVVNATVLIQENSKVPPSKLKLDLQKQMIQVLTRNRNNFGKSQLWVEGPISAVSAITDFDECEDSDTNDCHSKAECVNTLGSFECRCLSGYGDPFEKDKRKSGRRCESCSGKNHCNGRGECLIENGQRICMCSGNYYGSQCDIDGEVLAVAIGASVSAVVIIGLTLACLCMWSRKWKKEEQKAALMSRMPFGGMATQALSYLGGKVTNPYQQHISMDERLRWAQVADGNMSGNIYVQNDPMSMHTSPTLMGQTLMESPPMMSARRSAETVDTTMEDLFIEERQPKRPRSRAASQSQLQGGIYYDLEPDGQNEIYASRSMMHIPPAQFCVPMTPMGHYAHSSRGFYT